MNETVFDALAASETFAQAGFDERHAKAVAGVMRQAVDADCDKLATKADITDLRAGLAALETRLTVRLFGGLLAMGSLLVAAMAALKLFA